MNKVADRIVAEIQESGAITFARYMELALYCPNCGYYEREEDMIGREGDYYTSACLGGLFGELLAFEFAERLEGIQRSRGGRRSAGLEAMQIVEAGAHGGQLARDVVAELLRHQPAAFKQVQYWIIEPSARRRAWQQQNLAGCGGAVRWADSIAELRRKLPEPGKVRGVIFCNELLDAMPAHRLGWDANRRLWFEWGVTLQGERFAWARMHESASRQQSNADAAAPWLPPSIGPELLAVLPDGFTVEVCPAAEKWWREAANGLGQGSLLTVDYGLTAEELLMPGRNAGTLRAYRRHRPSNDVLASPGEQDLTAHVDFSAIRTAGESAGLKTEVFQTQAQFLTRIAAAAWQMERSGESRSPKRLRQFHTLTHPEHLGRSFRVLVQSRV